MRYRSLVFFATLAVAVSLVPAAAAVSVQVRVEGKTQTIYGAAEPRLDFEVSTVPPSPVLPNALHALEAASQAGEFYYHVTETSFGSYVDQIGRFAAAGTAGWVFKVNGVSPPVGADRVELKDGDRVLWYWAQFGVVPGGPPTLTLERRGKRCYRVLQQDDAGRTTLALGAVLVVGGRRVHTRRGVACLKPHVGLVRATKAGTIRSNAVR